MPKWAVGAVGKTKPIQTQYKAISKPFFGGSFG
jgi:hypothetical protein